MLEAFSTIDKQENKTILTLLIIPVKKIVLVEQNKKIIFWIRIESTFGGSQLNLFRQLSEFIS